MISFKKYLAEFIGTFGLTLVVALSLAGKFPVPTPVLAGLTLMLFVYSIGAISGCHINPAVTLALWSLKKIKGMEVLGYIIAQFLGAGLAYWVGRAMITIPPVVAQNNWAVFGAELLGTALFTFGIAAVVHEKVPAQMSGVVVGGSLLMGISIAATISNGVLNPAVAFGVGSFSLAYVMGPIAGAMAGMWLYRWIMSPNTL